MEADALRMMEPGRDRQELTSIVSISFSHTKFAFTHSFAELSFTSVLQQAFQSSTRPVGCHFVLA